MNNEKVYIIAEAGVNHNGSIQIAKKMVDAAVCAGVDAIKFQTFNPEKLVCRNAKKARYQIENTESNETQFDMLKSLQLSQVEFIELKKYCDNNNIDFISTPFDVESLAFLYKIGVKTIKIPSGEINNYPLLVATGKTMLPVILSTGMSIIDDVNDAIKVLKHNGTKDIVVLQCNTEYPTPYEDANVNSMIFMRDTLKCKVGYSDHTIGSDVAIAAVAVGAKVIEKHFTLDKTMEGPDHKASIEPDELCELVKSIRNVEKAMGSYNKVVSSSEAKNIDIVRKSIVASKKINKGEIFTEDNITTKRPGNGMSPMKWNDVIGHIAKKDYEEDEMIYE